MPSYTISVILYTDTTAASPNLFVNSNWVFSGPVSTITFSDDDTLGLGDDAPLTETGSPATITSVNGSTTHPLVGQPIYMAYVRSDDGDGDTDSDADVVFLNSGTLTNTFGAVAYPGSGWSMSPGDTFVNGGFPTDHPTTGSWSTEGFPDPIGTIGPDPCTLYDFIQTNVDLPDIGENLSVTGGELEEVDEPISFGGGDPTKIDVGDTMFVGADTYTVTQIETQAVQITYDGGSSTALIKMLAVEVTDGTSTFTYYVPIDGTPYPDITEIEVVEIGSNLDAFTKSYFDEDDDVTIICFAEGTDIACLGGPCRVENLSVGDRVLTMDNGYQTVRWIGSRTVAAQSNLAPIVIKKGAHGAEDDLCVSPQHRVLISDWRAQVMFGQTENLVAAKHLVNGDTVYRKSGGTVTYYHILFDQHEIVFSNGVPTESFHPGQDSIAGLTDDARIELLDLFPELSNTRTSYGLAARPTLKQFEIDALMR
ncbi:MAG: Hint domain-containing protein [Pseudomonadota bacterium]